MTWRLAFQQLLHWGVREGATPFSGFLHLPIPYKGSVLSNAASSSIFWVFGMTWLRIVLWFPGSLANPLTIILMCPFWWFCTQHKTSSHGLLVSKFLYTLGSLLDIYICIYIYTIVIVIHNRLKFILLLLVPSWLRGRDLDWHLSQLGFDPSYGKLVCLATLMSSDRMKQICLWMTIYIYYHPQTDWFIVSQFFCVARYSGWFQLGLKPA